MLPVGTEQQSVSLCHPAEADSTRCQDNSQITRSMLTDLPWEETPKPEITSRASQDGMITEIRASFKAALQLLDSPVPRSGLARASLHPTAVEARTSLWMKERPGNLQMRWKMPIICS